jgi:putative restriction endonuclease
MSAGSTTAAPTPLDNGLALCALHHKLFDRAALGLTAELHIKVSAHYTSRTSVGRLLYDLPAALRRPTRDEPNDLVDQNDRLRRSLATM